MTEEFETPEESISKHLRKRRESKRVFGLNIWNKPGNLDDFSYTTIGVTFDEEVAEDWGKSKLERFSGEFSVLPVIDSLKQIEDLLEKRKQKLEDRMENV